MSAKSVEFCSLMCRCCRKRVAYHDAPRRLAEVKRDILPFSNVSNPSARQRRYDLVASPLIPQSTLQQKNSSSHSRDLIHIVWLDAYIRPIEDFPADCPNRGLWHLAGKAYYSYSIIKLHSASTVSSCSTSLPI